MSTFLLLLGFALFKVVVGLSLVYLGFRGSGQDEPHEGFGRLEPDPPPHLPTRRPRSLRRRARGGPARSPARAHARRARAVRH
jgi:hypothetical protein